MRQTNFYSLGIWFITALFSLLLPGGTSLRAQDEPTSPATDIDQPANPLKIAVVVQDSTGMHWNASYFDTAKSPSGEKLTFLAGDSTDCSDVDCYLAAAENRGADFFLLLNLDDKHITLYDPASEEKLAESSLDNPFAVFETASEAIAEATPTDSTLVDSSAFTAMMPDSTMIDSISTAMDSLAAEALAITQAAAVPSKMEPELPVSTPMTWTNRDKVFYRHLRTFGAFVENPSHLAMEHETGTAWSVVLPMPFIPLQVRFNNSALTPGWVKDWFHGQYLTASDKEQMTRVLRGKTLDIQSLVDIPTILGVRVGPVGVNLGAHVAVRGVLPGDLLMLPWSNFTSDNPLTNLDLNFEILNYLQTNVGYGQVIPTPIGNIRAGAGIGLYLGYGYARVKSDEFTLATNLDSIVVDFSGRGFFTDPSIGLLTEPNTGNMNFGDFSSSLGFGLNFGAGLDLYDLTGQHVDVQVALSNIGAKLTWNNLTEKTFSAHAVVYDVAEVMDNRSDSTYIDSLLNPAETVAGIGSHSVSIPTRIAVVAQYQPISRILVQASYRQSFSDGIAWTTDPRLGLYLGYFPVPAVELRGAMNSFMGQTTWTAGFGLHFKHYELGFDLTAINGFGGNASGLGLRLSQSLYF